MRPRLVVSVHDVAPATVAAARAWCADLDRRGVRLSLLVVPGPWSGPPLAAHAGTVGWLRDRVAAGDEAVLHGWAHRAGPGGPGWRRAVGRVVARGAAEFAALTEPEAYALVAAGRAVLDELALPVAGFTPPGWLHSPGTLTALARSGLRYTTSHRGVTDLHTGGRLPALALSHRPGGTGERAAAALLERLAVATARRGGTVRIALHPADLARPGLRAATLRAVDATLAAGAVPTTYGRLVPGWGAG
jgi:predicted deacetylase